MDYFILLLGIWLGARITLLIISLIYFAHISEAKKIATDIGYVVQLSPRTSFLTSKDFNQWTWETCDLWMREESYSIAGITNSIRGTTIVIIDQPSIPVDYGKVPARMVYGVAYQVSKTLYLCSLSLGHDKYSIRKQIEYLYKHEISHIISGYVGNIWTEEESHPVFRKLGLKYAESQKECSKNEEDS